MNIDIDTISSNPSTKTLNRRRLATNGGNNYVEMLVVVGPYRVDSYKESYPNSWYEHLVADHTGIHHHLYLYIYILYITHHIHRYYKYDVERF